MAECVPPSAAELTRQLEAYSASRGHPSELVQLLRAPRLGLRSSPAFRSTDEPLLASLSTYPGLTRVPLNSSTYGAHAPFWPALASAWQVDAHRLSRDDGDDDHEDSIPAILALAAFLLSLCTQEPHNQQQAVCARSLARPPLTRRTRLTFLTSQNLHRTVAAQGPPCRLVPLQPRRLGVCVRASAPSTPPNTHSRASPHRTDTDMTRVCCQALANLVTDNQPLASSFFPQRLDLELDDNLIQCVPPPCPTARLVRR